MRLRRAEAASALAEGAPRFEGAAWRDVVVPAANDTEMNVLVVTFASGSRTKWHRHPGGQVLYAVHGVGVVETAAESHRVAVGDVVYADPGERHRHGAAEDSEFVHLAISIGANTIWDHEETTPDAG